MHLEKTGCCVEGLDKLLKKDKGHIIHQDSRPNQTAHSWGRARLASAITGGKCLKYWHHILKKSCKKGSKALRLADRSKYKKSIRRVAKTWCGSCSSWATDDTGVELRILLIKGIILAIYRNYLLIRVGITACLTNSLLKSTLR